MSLPKNERKKNRKSEQRNNKLLKRNSNFRRKDTIAESKNLLVRLNSIVEMTEDRISELEDTPIEFTQSEQHRKK